MCICTYVHMYVRMYAGAPVVAGGQLLGFVSLLLPRRPRDQTPISLETSTCKLTLTAADESASS